jgi:hypothetical protein
MKDVDDHPVVTKGCGTFVEKPSAQHVGWRLITRRDGWLRTCQHIYLLSRPGNQSLFGVSVLAPLPLLFNNAEGIGPS